MRKPTANRSTPWLAAAERRGEMRPAGRQRFDQVVDEEGDRVEQLDARQPGSLRQAAHGIDEARGDDVVLLCHELGQGHTQGGKGSAAGRQAARQRFYPRNLCGRSRV